MTAGNAEKTAADVMRRDVITVRDHWDIREALHLFEQKRISGAPVLDREGDLVGVLSVTDIARAAEKERRSGDSDFYKAPLAEGLPSGFHIERYDEIPVKEVMTPLVIDALETTPVPRLAALMIDLHIHRVIITRGSKLVGIVTSLDLLRLLREGGAGAAAERA
jgi:CBS domain-containing protein